jgi:glycosyltransferase involved in cell wall biosynthesis
VVYERGIGYFKQKHIRATENIGASIPVSEAVRRFLLNYEFKTKVIEIIYDGLDPSAYINKRSRAEMKSRLHIPTDGKIIGIVGNIRPWKGQKYFVEAFGNLAKQHDNIYGLIIGGCAEEDHAFESGLKDSVRKAGLQDRLLFLGYRNDVPELLPILDVFVHASTKPEPFGMVILEAMAARIPIVATSLGGPREILNDGECGILVPPEDGKAIAAACNRYLHDSGFGQDTVNKAYERLMMNFHIHQTVEKTVDLFNRVAGSSSQLNG